MSSLRSVMQTQVEEKKKSLRSTLGREGAAVTNKVIREYNQTVQQIAATYDTDQLMNTLSTITPEQLAAITALLSNGASLKQIVGKEDYLLRRQHIYLRELGRNWDKCIEKFSTDQKELLKENTLRGYIIHIKTFKDWLESCGLFAEAPAPADIADSSIIEEFMLDCLKKGKSKTTANAKLAALKVFYGYLLKKKIVEFNPCDGIKKYKANHKPVYSFSPEEVNAIFSVIPTDTWRGARDYSIFRMIFDTGCRVSEALQIKISNIQFKNGIPRIILFPDTITKDKEYREVHVPRKLAAAIMNWLNKRYAYKITQEVTDYLHVGVPFEETDENGKTIERFKPLHIRNLNKYFKQYCELAGIKDTMARCSPYTLKHTFCKLFLEGGGSANALQEIVGHSDERMIKKYTALLPKEKLAAHERYAPSEVFDI
ncbi:MAG: tyrosine-type recombinase/integrase [Firmicutes bacterium]|nr:tyrosine-type recombinase/integrase [Bacillota bacterium]